MMVVGQKSAIRSAIRLHAPLRWRHYRRTLYAQSVQLKPADPGGYDNRPSHVYRLNTRGDCTRVWLAEARGESEWKW